MYRNLFSDFDDNDRIWIYAFNQSLTTRDSEIVNREFTQFVSTWKSHGTRVTGAFHLLLDQFVVLCVSQKTDVSGCSIDASTRVFKMLKEQYNLDALDLNLVYYRENDKITTCPRADFVMDTNLNIRSGTIIFDTSVQTLGEFRAGNFEIPIAESWLAHKVVA